MSSLNHEWVYREYVNRENLISHAPLEPEMDFYSCVKNGDINMVNEYLRQDFTSIQGLGRLSDNNIRNFRYHFIITAAMISRACIESGLAYEQAYSLSDFYIQKVDRLDSLDDINELHAEMVLAYTGLMNKLISNTAYSKPVVRCINYIYTHLHTRITLKQLSAETSLSEGHLSRIFKKEVGISVSEYIMHQKLETAKNMLRYSDYSPSEISSILGFPSQSYFTECFRKHTGITPKKYINTASF